MGTTDTTNDPGAHNDPQADPVLGLLDAAREAADHLDARDAAHYHGPTPLVARLRAAIAAASEYVGGAPAAEPGAVVIPARHVPTLHAALSEAWEACDDRARDLSSEHGDDDPDATEARSDCDRIEALQSYLAEVAR